MGRIITQEEAMDKERYEFIGLCTVDDGAVYEIYNDVVEQETCHSLQPSWLQSHVLMLKETI
jgi:hypothetical protein